LPLLESGFNRNIGLHTQLDSSEYYKSGGALWSHRPDEVIIRACVHIVVLAGLHAVVRVEGADVDVLAMQPMLYSSATTERGRSKQGSEMTTHELRPCGVATGS
jgi:hypothetical protein